MKKKFMYLKLYCIKSLIQRLGQKADAIISGTLTTTHHRKLFNADKMEVPNQINPLLTLNLVDIISVNMIYSYFYSLQ